MQLRVDVSADGRVLATLVENELQVGFASSSIYCTCGKILRHAACSTDSEKVMLWVASESFVSPLQRLPEPLIIKPVGRAEYFEVNLLTCGYSLYASLSRQLHLPLAEVHTGEGIGSKDGLLYIHMEAGPAIVGVSCKCHNQLCHLQKQTPFNVISFLKTPYGLVIGMYLPLPGLAHMYVIYSASEVFIAMLPVSGIRQS